LNVNLIVWDPGEGVVEHVNEEVDVLLVGISGAGIVEVEGREHTLQAGQALIVAKGSRRAIRSTGERFAYLTCHRLRPGLWPQRRARTR
jgi:quercetin dioxygenase-like cupin family protein